MKIIAHIESEFTTKFGIPRQSGLVDELEADIIFEPEYRNYDAFRGLEEYTHIWIIWEFSEVKQEQWRPTVRPPRLGGNKRMGVFATRSPFRPNPIGLSCVRLLDIRNDEKYGPVLHIAGADLMNGTPIFDIKPYLSYVDSYPDANGGFAEKTMNYRLTVSIPDDIGSLLKKKKLTALTGILENDPRPSYQNDPHRIYGFEFSGYEVKFRVSDGTVYVTSIEKAIKQEVQ